MSTFVPTILLAIVTYPLVFLVAFPVLLGLHRAFGRAFDVRRIVIFFLLGLSVWGPLCLTNMPLPNDYAAFCANPPPGLAPRLEPFQFVAPAKYFLSVLVREGRVLIIPFLIGSFLNFWMLFPAGCLLRVLKKRHFLVPIAIGLVSSLFLELTQLTGIWGIIGCTHRTFDVDDIILNTAGFFGGWVGMSVLFWLTDRFRSGAGDRQDNQ